MMLNLTMTLGDLVVAGCTVGTIVGAYYALKHLLTSMHQSLTKLIERVDEHDEILVDHGEGIAALETKLFGRRRGDGRRRHGG